MRHLTRHLPPACCAVAVAVAAAVLPGPGAAAAAAPTSVPAVSGPTVEPVVTGPATVALGRPIELTVSTPPSDQVQEYEYAVMPSGVLTSSVPATTVKGRRVATVVSVPTHVGPNWLQVRGVDRQGRRGPTAHYAFRVTNDAQLQAAWRFEEGAGTVALPDSPELPAEWTMQLGAGAGWTTDTWYGASSLALDGASGSAATTASVVRPDRSFGVGAAVRLDDLSRSATAVSADGSGGAGTPTFRLGYDQPSGAWVFARPDADGPGQAEVAVLSSGPAVAGEWVHLYGAYDAGTGRSRLYVDGVAEGPWAPTGSTAAATGPLRVGGAGAQHWTGAVDGVVTTTGVLADAQVMSLRYS